MFGINLYQGDGAVDQATVKNYAKTFAYLKATEGVTIKDDIFSYNIK